ncbi:MAG: pyridoxal-phosphate dependent enzyme [Candidatus Hydrogenedens sp.]|nr:pyridoxal-phosphate dependent enzyme [Candidatus Hydrogenedens sp.]
MLLDATLADFEAALARIAPFVHQTPVHTSRSLNARAGAEVYLKCELFQRAGAFKMRGAANAIARLSDAERARGVVAHSSGNHAQAVALAAQDFGIAAHIVMPENVPRVKREATEGYGAKVTLCAPTMQAREAACAEIASATGAALIPPYDHDDVAMGQGTCALEFLRQVPGLDTLLVPVSGGGLISGVALAAHAVNPDISILGCEPALADDAARSMAAGQVVVHPAGPTIADGLRAQVCDRTFAVLQRHVAAVLTVSEDEIREAMVYLWERTKLMAEPSAATALAPLLFQRDRVPGQRIGVILSGGNVEARLA